MQITPRIKAYLLLLLVSVIWGIASPVIKFTLFGIEPDLFLAYRFAISTLISIITFMIVGFKIPKDFKLIGLVLLYGFLNSVVSLGFLFFGMKSTTVLEAGLITLASPLLVSTAGVYFLREKITKRKIIGMGIAIFGTLLTIIEPIITSSQKIEFSGNILILLYVISTVATSIIAKKVLREGVSPLIMTNVSFALGFVCFSVFLLSKTSFVDIVNTLKSVDISYHIGVLYMAIISGNLAFFLSNKAQKTIEIGEQSLFAYLYPIFSLPLAVLWLNEKFSTIYILGGIIITAGVVIAEFKKKRYNSSSER